MRAELAQLNGPSRIDEIGDGFTLPDPQFMEDSICDRLTFALRVVETGLLIAATREKARSSKKLDGFQQTCAELPPFCAIFHECRGFSLQGRLRWRRERDSNPRYP